jgi:acyl carrier protein
VPPSNEIEQTIAVVWQTHLGIEQIGIHDPFFELGGNSLMGILIIAQLQKALQTPLSAAVLFEYPTIATLAAMLATNQGSAEVPDLQMSSQRGKLRKERIQKKKHIPSATR